MSSKAAKTTSNELNQKPKVGKKRKHTQSVDDIFTYSNQMELKFSYTTKNTRTSLAVVDSSDEEEEECVKDVSEFTRISEDEEDEDADDSQEIHEINDDEESLVETPRRNSSIQDRSPSPLALPPPPSQAEVLRVQRQLRARNKKTHDFDVQFGRLQQLCDADIYSPVVTNDKKSSEVINLDDSLSHIVVRNKPDRKMKIKVRTRSGIKRFTMKAGDQFEGILKDLAETQNVPVENILLSLNQTNILAGDTPLSKGVTVADILECVIMESGPVVDEENLIEIKIQGNDSGSRKTFSVSKTKPLESLFMEYAKFRNMPKSKLKFLFDGDALQGNETPEDLDMEDENVIDVQVHS